MVRSVSLSAHLWHDSAINVQTLTEADGKVGWGGYGSTWAYREGVGGGKSGGGLGKGTVAGTVVDSSGNRVADVELQVGKQTVYTGATGGFELTVGKRRAYAVEVVGSKILFREQRSRRENQSRLLWSTSIEVHQRKRPMRVIKFERQKRRGARPRRCFFVTDISFKSLYRKRANTPCSCVQLAHSHFRYNIKAYRELRWVHLVYIEDRASFTPVFRLRYSL